MPKIIYQNQSNDELLKPVRDFIRLHKTPPSFRGWRRSGLKPSTKVLTKRFGTWNNMLEKANDLPERRLNPSVNDFPDDGNTAMDKKVYTLDMFIIRNSDLGAYNRFSAKL